MVEEVRGRAAGLVDEKTVPLVVKTKAATARYLRKIKATRAERTASKENNNEENVDSPEKTLATRGDINFLAILETVDSEVTYCKYSETYGDLAVGYSDASVRIFHGGSGTNTNLLYDDECKKFPGAVTAIDHKPNYSAYPVLNTFVVSYDTGCLKGWQFKYDQCLYTIRENRRTLGLAYHRRLCKFVSFGDDGVINMYDEETSARERSFFGSELQSVIDGHLSCVYSACFHPWSTHELISGGIDSFVMCWDDRQPNATKHFKGAYMRGNGIDFNNEGNIILTCSYQDNAIQLWDYGSGKLIESIIPDNYPSKLLCGKFIPKHDYIVCGGADPNLIRIVNLNTKETDCLIRNTPGPILSLDIGKTRRKLRFRNKNQALVDLPRIPFVTGKTAHVVDFG